MSKLPFRPNRVQGRRCLSRAGRQRRCSWRLELDDKRAESGRNEATEHRHWLILTHEADECEKGCTFTTKSLADYILNEDEGDCGVFGLSKIIALNKHNTYREKGSENIFFEVNHRRCIFEMYLYLFIYFNKGGRCGEMTQYEYVRRGRQKSPMQLFDIGHMSLAVTFFDTDFSFPSWISEHLWQRRGVWVSCRTRPKYVETPGLKQAG